MLEYRSEDGQEFLSYQLSESDQLDTLSCEMLSNNEISGLLPMKMTEVDDRRTLRYDVKGLTGLGKSLESGSLSRDGLLMILQGLLDLAVRLEDYLIPQEQLLYNKDCLFLDLNKKQVMAVCLPIEREPNGSYCGLGLELIRYTHFTADSDRLLYDRLYNVFESGSFQQKEIREILNQMRPRYSNAPVSVRDGYPQNACGGANRAQWQAR